MGFYFRKSKSIGPVRLNFSKSGIGVSTGVKGARLSLGPNGTYINIGRNGIYYRKKIGSTSGKTAHGTSCNTEYSNEGLEYAPADVIRVAPATGGSEFENSILKDIKRARAFDWLWVIAFLLLSFAIHPSWSLLLIFVLRCLFPKLSNAVIQHDLDSETLLEWEKFTEIVKMLKTSKKLWIIETAQRNSNTKYHAGAFRNLSRRSASVKVIKPKRKTGFRVKSDSVSVAIKSAKCSLLFLPSVVILKKGHRYAVCSYDELNLRSSTTNFIESDSVPRDAEITRYTWQYVNKDGTADKRFSRNRRYPVCRYGLLNFYAGQQINVELHISNYTLSENVGNAYTHYMRYVKKIGSYQPQALNYRNFSVDPQCDDTIEPADASKNGLFSGWKRGVHEETSCSDEFSPDGKKQDSDPIIDYENLFESGEGTSDDENALVDDMLFFMNEE